MLNRILTEDGWQERVRNIIGVNESYLPDDDIEKPEIITVAEAYIIQIVPEYASLTGDKKVWLELATVCECAALLCPSMHARVPEREQGPHFTNELKQNWNTRRLDFERERDLAIGKIIASSAGPNVPHFGRTKG